MFWKWIEKMCTANVDFWYGRHVITAVIPKYALENNTKIINVTQDNANLYIVFKREHLSRVPLPSDKSHPVCR